MIMTNSSFACLFKTKKKSCSKLKNKPVSHVSFLNQKTSWEKKKSPPSSSGAANQQLAEVGERQPMFADLVVKLIQCLGVWGGVLGEGFLAAGFGIILGCGALGSGGGAGPGARLAVGPAGGLRGMSATAVPAGRVSPATTFFHGGLQSETGSELLQSRARRDWTLR